MLRSSVPGRVRSHLDISYLLVISLLGLLCLSTSLARASPLRLDTAATEAGEDENLSIRDAFSQNSDPNGDSVRLTSLESPNSANRTHFQVGGGSIVTFVGQRPTDNRLARKAYVVVHGAQRDGADYWNIINRAYHDARGEGITSDDNSIRIAPQFLSTRMDAEVRTGSRLGWADQDAWAGGDASTAPRGSSASLASVLDTYLDHLSNRATYPNLDTVTFVGHGAGAQAVQRYAVLGKNPSNSRIRVRYVLANPSTMVYFTPDRSVPVATSSCARYDDFRYGLKKYTSPYPKSLSNAALFKRYLTRDVHYLVGDADTKTTSGDQSCAGRAAGGGRRRDRSYDYWAYLHLLSGRSNVPSYPGLFPALDPRSTKTRKTGTYPTSSAATIRTFRTNTFNHRLTIVPGVGHSAKGMISSNQGLSAIFGN